MIALRCVAVFIAAATVAAAPPDKITKESIESGGRQRAYYLYVPPSAGDKPMPLIVLLHGSGRRGDSQANPWKDLAKKEGIVLVAPDSLDQRGWLSPQDGPDFLYDVVEAVRKTQKIDARRMYVFGHSAGAVFGLNIGLMESRYFAAVAVHAGAYREPAEFRAFEAFEARRKIPFALWVGTRDQFFPLADVRATRDAFVKVGLPFELTEMPGHDHNYYVMADDINRQVWAFLKGQVLDADPEYEHLTFR
jgi:poly(3-hydroxybutyrate) depolymerase